MTQNSFSFIMEAQQHISPLMMKNTTMRKHRELIGTYIKCPRCGEINEEKTLRIYLEDRRYMTSCVRCQYTGLLKEYKHN